MDASTHPVVIEYAIRECFKHKTPKAAASITKRKLAGSSNLFIGGGAEIVEIDEQHLENQIWLQIGLRAIAAISKVKTGYEGYAIEGTLQEFGQKITQRNIERLETAMKEVSQDIR